jgi:hypothetical protein
MFDFQRFNVLPDAFVVHYAPIDPTQFVRL